jgi:hypothetical protein
MVPVAYTRDPISTWFDPAAIRLIRRAYANRDGWTGVYLAPPTIGQRIAAAAESIWDLGERDRWGEVRWVRAFKRSCFWHVKMFGYSDGLHVGDYRNSPYPAVALEWETGARVYKAGWPSRRWAIRVAVHDRGTSQFRAAAREAKHGYWPGTELQSTTDDRDWAQG